jgi:hypothetical protein
MRSYTCPECEGRLYAVFVYTPKGSTHRVDYRFCYPCDRFYRIVLVEAARPLTLESRARRRRSR